MDGVLHFCFRAVRMATEHAAAKKRVDELQEWEALCKGQETCSFIMIDESTVSGRLVAVKGDLSELVVCDLTTPLGTFASVVLRREDLDKIIVSDTGKQLSLSSQP